MVLRHIQQRSIFWKKAAIGRSGFAAGWGERSGAVLQTFYLRDELGVARGTFDPIWAGLKFFYLNTLGYDWPLFTKKKSASLAECACPPSVAMRIAAA